MPAPRPCSLHDRPYLCYFSAHARQLGVEQLAALGAQVFEGDFALVDFREQRALGLVVLVFDAGLALAHAPGLDDFWRERLGGQRGGVAWEEVLELLYANRLPDPRSELLVQEKWFPQTAMDILLDCDERVAELNRLYRCLDHLARHRDALEAHLAAKWKDLFGADDDSILYGLTSLNFEGGAEAIPKARRGYSRDQRPDCKQVVIALVVSAEGSPLPYEIFPGNTIDVTTLRDIVQSVEARHGRARRVWVFDPAKARLGGQLV